MSNMKPLGLYVHIPFCQVKCPYCDFYSVANTDASIEPYMEKLQEEIAYFAARTGSGYRVTTIFFGGGTPSYVPTKAIGQTLENLTRLFTVAAGAEITLEMNPGSCEVVKLVDWRRMGINRISIGIQSFYNKELKFLGRVHTAEEAHAAIRAVHEAGYDNFNMDFIFALPGQTTARWEAILEQALTYDPPHLSAYNLTYEEGTPLAQQKRDGTVRPMPDDKELRLFQTTIRRLTAAGLKHYEISNFARPGKEAQHNLAYWRGQDYLGFGAGAHSFFKGKRFSKKRSLRHYLTHTSAHHVETIADEDLSPDRRFWELLAIGLRDLGGTPIAEENRAVRIKIDPWIRQGFLKISEGKLKLECKGLYYYDQIAASLIETAEDPTSDAPRMSPIPR